MQNKNIDMICAKYGSQIGKLQKISEGKQHNIPESIINKALGVLLENGVYALFLFLAPDVKADDKCFESKLHLHLIENLFALNDLFESLQFKQNQDIDETLDLIRSKLAKNLDDLFFARDVIETTLVYARYHRKAQPKEEA